MMTIKHYQKSAAGNLLATIMVLLSPGTPKQDRKTYRTIKKRTAAAARNTRINNIIKK